MASNKHDTVIWRTIDLWGSEIQQTSHLADTENQSTARRPNKTSSSVLSTSCPTELHPPSADPSATPTSSSPLPLNFIASKCNHALQSHHADTGRKKQEAQQQCHIENRFSGSVHSTMRRKFCEKIWRSKRVVDSSAPGDNTDGPSLNAITEELLNRNEEPLTHAASVQAELNSEPSTAVYKERESIRPRGSLNHPYSTSSHATCSSNGKTQGSQSDLRTKKKTKDGNDDSKSTTSQSETTHSSMLTTTCITPKLTQHSKYFDSHDSKQQKHNWKTNNEFSLSSPTPTVTTLCSSSTSLSRASSFEEGFKPSQSPFPNMEIMEVQKESRSGRSSVYPRACNGARNATRGRSPLRKRTSCAPAQVFDLPWQDSLISGMYSGPVSDLLQPNGEGKLVLKGNKFLTFYGHWANGELVSPLLNDDEKREQQRTASNESSKYHSAHQHRKKSSAECQQKSSRECREKTRSTKDSRLSKKLSTSRYHHQAKPEYKLGDVARTPKDMVIHRSNRKGIHSVSLLKDYDQAFIKRSNGLWTCAVVVERARQPSSAPGSRWYAKHEIDHESMGLEESMLFVINKNGATKIVRRKYWGRFIRRLKWDDVDKEEDGHC